MTDARRGPTLSAEKQALLAVRRMRAKLEAYERSRSEPIAIVGLGCRFPGGASDARSFWELLSNGVDAISEAPSGRFDTESLSEASFPRHGGFLGDVEGFDAGFFGISPKEAKPLDPQQRLVLECCWEALEDAGLAADRLAGSETGVYMGVSTNDYAHEQVSTGASSIDTYFGTGVAVASVAGRVSYVLGLAGPSLVVDTACSSSLVSVHLACQGLRAGECDLALAGGVNVMVSPEVSVAFSRAGMMAADGRCKTFDASADGYVRGEGCGVLVLKRLSDAVRNEDRILAVVRASAVNQDGRSSGFTVPSELAQRAVIERALERGGVAASEVSYVEAHGTGTKLGDPIELQALAAALGEGRKEPLRVGSVKTNLGHLEASAGVAGLIKVVLSLGHETIPPHLHLREPNPYVDWDTIPITVPVESQPWPRAESPRIAGVSSFGFTGTNAHVLLEEAPLPTEPASEPESEDTSSLRVLTLSAKTESSLAALAGRYHEHLAAEPVRLADVCFTANTGRSRHAYRLAVVAKDRDDASAKLDAFAAQARTSDAALARSPGVVSGKASPRATKVAFLFSGQGSQFAGMGRDLFESEKVFREALERCASLFEPHLDRPLLSVLYGEDPRDTALLDETAFAQPALFALEHALVELWRSLGVEPSYVLGHSIGEYAAACAASVLELESAVALVAARGRLMQSVPADGMMAAVFCDETRLRERIVSSAEGELLSIAAVNGPANAVVSGPRAAVVELIGALETEGVASRELSVGRAFHSAAMDSILDAFDAEARKYPARPPRLGFVSSAGGGLASEALTRPSYWRDQIRKPVLFQRGIEVLAAKGVDVFLEIGPSTTLSALALAGLPGSKARFVSSLAKGKPGREHFLETLASLWVEGAAVRWEKTDEASRPRRVSLPSYPFERERHWIARRGRATLESAAPAASGDPSPDWLYELEWTRPDGEAARFLPSNDGVAADLSEALQREVAKGDASAYERSWPAVQSLAVLHIARALESLGLRPSPGDSIAVRDAARRFGVAPRHHRLWDRLFDILGEDGFLEIVEGDVDAGGRTWRVLGWPDSASLAEARDALERSFPEGKVELGLLRDCGDALAPVLRDELSPLEVLFPGGESSRIEALYRSTPSARAFNDLVAKAIGGALAGRPEGVPVRVLELGAGTGGTTSAALEALPRGAGAGEYEYVFTDVSAAFLEKAREAFSGRPDVTFARLDIEQSPLEQGFQLGGFDIVLAANVLHATRDVRRAVRHARSLLAPGGLLVLLEVCEKERFSDLTVGLTEGWWRFDDDVRVDYPTLRRSEWSELLGASGFGGTRTVAVEGIEGASGVMGRQALVLATRTESPPPSRFVLLEGGGPITERIRRGLEARGHEVAVHAEEAAPERCRPVLADENRAERRPLRLVYLGALESRDRAPSGLCASVSTWLAALADVSRSDGSARLSIVTRGVQPAHRPVSEDGLVGASLWGLGRTAALEQPGAFGRLLDLSAEPTDEEIDQAVELLESDDAEGGGTPREGQVALDGRDRFVPRLTRAHGPPPSEALAPAADGVYLVTGGLGDIGCELARWLHARGARHILLTTRRDVPAPSLWDGGSAGNPGTADGLDETTWARLKELAVLRRAGAGIEVTRADVTDVGALGSLVDTIEQLGLSLRGIFHLAGELPGLGDVRELERDDFAAVMKSKIDGARNLHELSLARKLDLDVFVLFSSAASVWGAKGLGAYAAANHYLDTLAHYRASFGLPATSVNWARWGNTRPEWEDGFEAIGLGVMPSGAALDSMSRFLDRSASEPQVSVQPIIASVDWSRFRAVYEASGPRPLLSRLAGSSRSDVRGEAETGDDREATATAPLDIDIDIDVDVYVEASLKAVLGMDPRKALDREEGMVDAGLDSLMAVKLKNRIFDDLGVDVPVATLLQGTSLDALARHVADARRSSERAESIAASAETPERASFPLSLAQERLWFLHQLEPSSSLYNNVGMYRFSGALDMKALTASVRSLRRRHEILRTRFDLVSGSPEQIVEPEGESRWELGYVDVSGLSERARDLAIAGARAAACFHPFDLTSEAPFRLVVLRLSARGDEHLVIATIHHVASDGWSFTVLLDELQALYQSFRRGEAVHGGGPEIQYRDFARWQRRAIGKGDLDDKLGYWREKLRGPLPALELPLDRARPRTPSFRGRSARLALDASLAARLRSVAREQGATTFMTLLAGLVVLMQRTTGQEDILVGSPSAGRERSELKNLIGVFVNHLVLRTETSGRLTFGEVLARVRAGALEAYENEVPFEKLLETVAPERDLSRTPLFQVYFNLLNLPEEPRRFEELTVAVETPREAESKFDLTFYAVQRASGVELTAIFNADLFDATTIEAMLADYRAILEAAASRPDLPVREIPLRSSAAAPAPDRADAHARRRWLEPRARPTFETTPTLLECLDEQFSKRADAVAVATERHRWSYGELGRRSRAVARGLGGDRAPVGLLFEHDAPMLSAVVGAIFAGRPYVPLDPSYPPERLSQIVQDAGCVEVVTEGSLRSLAVTFGTQAEAVRDVEVLLAEAEAAAQAGAAAVSPLESADPDALAYILYTSGSTGKPKGVMQSYRNLFHHARRYSESLGLGADDRLTLLSSFTFDAAVMDIFGALVNGATLVPVDVRRGGLDALAGAMRREGVTIFHSTPTLYRYFVQSLGEDEVLRDVRAVVLGGEEVRRADFEAFRRHFSTSAVFVNGLGPTESTLGLQFFLDHETELTRDRVPVGYAVEGSEVLLLDRDGHPNEIFGEIAIEGEHVALGYWNQEALTRAAFVQGDGASRRYRTGDVGRKLPSGAVEFLGRADGHVKIRGYRVEPREIEIALEKHPAVREAVVIAHEPRRAEGSTDRPAERELAAFFVPRSGGSAEAAVEGEELRRLLLSSIPGYMVPPLFVALTSIPLTPTGKVDRRALAAELPERAAIGDGAATPHTETEERLAALWCETLGLERVGMRTSFFELGGHSLLATRLAAAVQAVFGVVLPLRNVFETPTVADMAAWLDAHREPKAESAASATPRITRLSRDAHRVRVASRDAVAVAEVLKQRAGGGSDD